MDLCIKIVPNGELTPLIDKLKKGDGLEVFGPMGVFVIKEHSMNKPIVFVSTGTGISPFRSMIEYLLENNFKNKIILLTGYKYRKDILYKDEFIKLEKNHKNFSYDRILSRSEKEEKGHVQKLIEKNFIQEADYYICGLKEMVFSVKDLLMEKGIPKENIFFERYN